MPRLALVLAALATLVATLVVAPFAGGGGSAANKASVTVTMKEFKFSFSKRSVPHGAVVFKLVNKGKVKHDLKIGGKKSKIVKPGGSGTLAVTFKKKGSYTGICTVDAHARLGMKKTLKVS